MKKKGDIMAQWLTGWSYRKSHEIVGSTAGAQTNYQVLIIVHYESGTDYNDNTKSPPEGHVYVDGKSRADFQDIRFTKDDGVTELDYWFENEETAEADGYGIFWVEVPSIPASPDTATIYVYYGNPTATTTSTDFREDYTTYAEVDPNNHIEKTAHHIDFYAIKNEDAYLYKDAGVGHFTDFRHLLAVRTTGHGGDYPWSNVWVLANDLDDLYGLRVGHKTAIFAMFYYHPSYGYYINIGEMYDGTCYLGTRYSGLSENTWYYLEIIKSGTSLTLKIYSDPARTTQVHSTEITLHGDWSFRYIYGCNTYNDGSTKYIVVEIEDLCTFKYVDPEPSHGDWGSEETVAVTLSVSVLNESLDKSRGIAGETVTYTATVQDENGNALPSTFKVTLKIDDVILIEDQPLTSDVYDPATKKLTLQWTVPYMDTFHTVKLVWSEQTINTTTYSAGESTGVQFEIIPVPPAISPEQFNILVITLIMVATVYPIEVAREYMEEE